jgi:hypothetical protein
MEALHESNLIWPLEQSYIIRPTHTSLTKKIKQVDSRRRPSWYQQDLKLSPVTRQQTCSTIWTNPSEQTTWINVVTPTVKHNTQHDICSYFTQHVQAQIIVWPPTPRLVNAAVQDSMSGALPLNGFG